MILDGKVAFINDSGEIVPPGAAMEIKDAQYEEGEIVLKVQKPTTSGISKGLILFNGPFQIPISGAGEALATTLIAAGVSGTLSLGAKLGPVNGQWLLGSTGSGYVYIKDATSIMDNGGIVLALGGIGNVLYRFLLNANWGSDTTADNASIYDIGGTLVAASSSTLLKDPESLFANSITGMHGYCIFQNGFYYVIQMSCPYTT